MSLRCHKTAELKFFCLLNWKDHNYVHHQLKLPDTYQNDRNQNRATTKTCEEDNNRSPKTLICQVQYYAQVTSCLILQVIFYFVKGI
jgi:hypothetical protein